jgi:flavin reductase (DIM6/NTAB) family NADH-FMN oxidoreductase RutF
MNAVPTDLGLSDFPDLNKSDLRNALGQFPTGVAVVTTRSADGEDLGMTVSSFNSLSLSPPLVLFSIDERAKSLPKWRNTRGYAINVLANHQQPLSVRFAQTLADKWTGVPFERGHAGAPILKETAACFVCRPYAQHESGDHVLFIAEILHVAVNHAATPLIFCQGCYGDLQPRSKN